MAKVKLEDLKLQLSVQMNKPTQTHNTASGQFTVTFSIESTSSEKNPPYRQESNLRRYLKRSANHIKPSEASPAPQAERPDFMCNTFLLAFVWGCHANAERKKTGGALQPSSDATPIKVALLPF